MLLYHCKQQISKGSLIPTSPPLPSRADVTIVTSPVFNPGPGSKMSVVPSGRRGCKNFGRTVISLVLTWLTVVAVVAVSVAGATSVLWSLRRYIPVVLVQGLLNTTDLWRELETGVHPAVELLAFVGVVTWFGLVVFVFVVLGWEVVAPQPPPFPSSRNGLREHRPQHRESETVAERVIRRRRARTRVVYRD